MRSKKELEQIAREIRIDILRMFYKSGTGHMSSALSCTDIFTALYFTPIVNWDMRFDEERDRVILSKGHACAALYAVLARAGFFNRKELLTYYQCNTLLGGHPDVRLNGIESATGALGHGICFATGTAKAAQIANKGYRTYVVLGDGECEEGSVWEAAMFAANHKLDNLVAIVDTNGLQASDRVEDIAPLGRAVDKWKAFGWNVIETDGHNFEALNETFLRAEYTKEKPSVVIAKTIKGKGVKISENNMRWHSRAPKGQEWESICEDFGINIEELMEI